eukprot:3443176-Prymnesium_polylepis.1
MAMVERRSSIQDTGSTRRRPAQDAQEAVASGLPTSHFESVAAACHCVHSCSRTMFEKSRDESSHRFDMKQVRVRRIKVGIRW